MANRFRRAMEDYEGLHIGCAPGTHSALSDAVMHHIEDKNGVLDIGAHSGALLLRPKGECTILIGRKSQADESLAVPDHYKDRREGRADRIGLDV